jgi:class 3 adenylate cyclase
MPAVETLSVLITDLVGSTGLAARVGPVAADELREEHFGLLREAIGACSGEEVKTTGDGLLATFTGAASAVGCAVAIQQRMERRNRSAAEPLQIRVGLALGDVTRDRGDVFGMPVVEAVRLCDSASGSQILTTELVRLIGGRDGHPFRPVGALELRGIPDPVTAYEVGWEPAGGWSRELGLPPRLLATAPSGYVGRGPEDERVRACFDAARGGARQTMLVGGEPGIGKTRLTTQAGIGFHEDGATILFGHCAEELPTPYGAWIQALTPLVEHAPDGDLEAYVERHGGELTRLVGGLARRMPGAPRPAQSDPETERYLLFSAVVGLLEQASAEAPVVLMLDDLHWADRPTLALLRHVIAETHEARLLVLGTYRDSDLAPEHPFADLLADLRREEGVERLTLRGLAEEAVFSMMQLAAGHALDATGAALAREITAETDGNPFFVGEMLRHLRESGAVGQTPDGRWELRHGLEELGMPQSVREVVHRRVERLGEGCRRALTTAAVIGREFDVELLLRVVHDTDDALIDLLDAATQASLLQERPERTGWFSFAHNLINHTLYDGLGATRRAHLHRRVAEALEDLCGDEPGPRVSELARHWTAAATSPVEAGKAVHYSRRAGERALAELAPDEAVRWFAQAQELLERVPGHGVAERSDLAICLGEAQRQAGQPAFREMLLGASRLAQDLGDPDRAARAALANNRGFASAFGEVDAERIAAIERALELDRGSDPARRARLLALQAMELQFDPDHERRRALADEAVALARTAGDVRILPYVLRDHFHAVWSADTLRARRATAREMVALAQAGDDPLARIWAVDRTLHAAAEAGLLARARESSELLLALTAALGQPGLRWHATYCAAGLAQTRGDLDEAGRLAEAAMGLGQQAGEEIDAVVVLVGQRCLITVEQGRPEEIIDVLEQAAVHNPGIPALVAGLAMTLCDLGRVPEAAKRLERATATRFAMIPRDQIYSTALATWARTAADVGSERAAALLYDLIEPWRDLLVWNGSTSYGSAESYLGMLAATLGSHDRAAEHFAAASALHRREGIVGWEARNLCYQARSLLAAGAPGQARAAADEALRLARGHGHGTSARHAETLVQEASRTAVHR